MIRTEAAIIVSGQSAANLKLIRKLSAANFKSLKKKKFMKFLFPSSTNRRLMVLEFALFMIMKVVLYNHRVITLDEKDGHE